MHLDVCKHMNTFIFIPTTKRSGRSNALLYEMIIYTKSFINKS